MVLQHEPRHPKITRHTSGKTFETVTSRDYISRELREQLLKADALLIPSEGYIDRPDAIYFPAGTTELYQFLKKGQGTNFTVDICIEHRDYKELALHADLLCLADFIVRDVAAPLLVALLAEYIIHILRERTKTTNVRSKLTVIDQKGSRQTEYSYNGPASEYGATMKKVVSKLVGSSKQATAKKNKSSKKRRRSKKG